MHSNTMHKSRTQGDFILSTLSYLNCTNDVDIEEMNKYLFHSFEMIYLGVLLAPYFFHFEYFCAFM
jgi:hypothetical protein